MKRHPTIFVLRVLALIGRAEAKLSQITVGP